ncbi:MAG: efflux RND transporter permease subunit [Candidatus Fermentibacterota bacterium]
MKLPALSVRRRVTFIMVFIGILGVGLFGLTQLGVDLFPKLVLPQMMVFSQLQGAGPEEVERLVTDYLEQAAASTKNVNTISSRSSPGISVVTAEFNWGTDMNQAETDLRRVLDRYENFIPDEATEPSVLLMDASLQPVMFVTFSSDVLSSFELRDTVEDEIVPLMNRVEGVGSVTLGGGLRRQIRVEADPVKLSQYGVSLSQMVGAIGSVREDVPAGEMEVGGLNASVKIGTAYNNLDDIRQLVVARHEGMPVLVEHLGEVIDGLEEKRNYTRLNGQEGIIAVVSRRSDANTVNVCEALVEQLGEINRDYSGVLSSSIIFNQADFINKSIGNLYSTGLQAILVAFLVLLFFIRSPKSSLVVAISMPMSIIATFSVMYFVDVNINIISLAGLALAVGLLVDNSIVVLENIVRHREEGEDRAEAAVTGASEVGMAITASTLTTLAVFVPILFVPGLAGQIFRDMSLTISFSLVVSLFVALSLIPLITSRMKGITARRSKGRLSRLIGGWLESLEERYYGWVNWAVRHKKIVIFSTLGLLVLSILVITRVPTEFFPDSDDGFISLDLYRSPGTELAETDSTIRVVEEGVREIVRPEHLEDIYANVGAGEGFGALFGASGSNEAGMFVKLVDRDRRNISMSQYEDSIRVFLDHIPDLEYEFSEGGPMGGGAPIEIVIYDESLEELRRVTERIAANVREIPGTRDVQTSMDVQRPELTFEPDPYVLALRGASRGAMASAGDAFAGVQAGFFREGGKEIDVVVRYPERYRSAFEDILAAPFMGAQLGSWGRLVSGLVPETINRRDQARMATVTCAASGRSLGDISADVRAMMDTTDLGGRRWEIGGQAEDQQETFGYLGLAILAAAALVYMVMASQFESYLEPFIIIFTVPMAFIGVAWTLFLTGTNLSVTALIGLLMLAGIVVNNGIVLVDFANRQRRDKGMEVLEAVTTAGRIRMRPILMTAFTTILAMLPLALGAGESGETWAPMARSVMGGLLVATALTLIVIPCLYAALGCYKQFGSAAACGVEDSD